MEHDVEEMERQYAQARSREAKAALATKEAKERLIAAKIVKAETDMAARGITPGTRVYAEYKDHRLPERRSEVGVYMGFAPSTYGTDVRIQVRKITKSGKAHATQNIPIRWYDAMWRIAE